MLLYYKFCAVKDPESLKIDHQDFCVFHQLRGRVFFAREGINGTVAGTVNATEAYKAYIESMPEFAGIQWKEDECNEIPFAKMKTKVRKSLVSMGSADGVDTPKYTANHLSPAEWRHVLETEQDYLLLDIRNKYETDIGKFENALTPPLENFYDFPKLAEELEAHKEKKILMYCTGGIRCEKFSALLVKEGFKNVHQLDGGILNYAKQEGGAHFKGSCFVFDDRLVVPITPETISTCHHCKKTEDKMLNCADMNCNQLIVCCDSCANEYQGACSTACKNSSSRRPFNAQAFRIPFRKKGVVFPEKGIAKKLHENG